MKDENDKQPDTRVKEQQDDEALGTVRDSSVVLPIEEVDAMCTNIEFVPYYLFAQQKYLFHLRVCEPEKYAGMMLQMYVRWNPTWEKQGVPRRAKLWQIIHVANAGPLKRGQKIKKSMFLGKIFRCRLSVATTESGICYSVVDTITKKVTG